MPKAIKRKAPELKLAKSLNWDRSGSVVKKIGSAILVTKKRRPV